MRTQVRHRGRVHRLLLVAGAASCLAARPAHAVPVVLSTTPADQTVGVVANTDIVVRFAAPLDPATVVPANVLVTSSQQGTVPRTVLWNAGALEIRIDPQRDFLAGERVTVTLGKGLHDSQGQSLPNGKSFQFSARTLAVPNASFGTSSTSWPIGSIALCLTVGDLTGDGLPEAVFSNVVPDSLTIYTPNGAGSFSILTRIAQASASLPRGVAIGDLDGDGRPDLVCSASGPNQVLVYRNLGGGSFAPAVAYGTGMTPYYAYVGDLDADGDLDVVTANFNGQSISVLKNQGGGVLAPAVDYPAGVGANSPRCVNGCDVDGDGDLDLVVCNGYSYDVSIFLNDGNGAFTVQAFRPPVGDSPQYLAVCDVTGDHIADVVTVNSIAESVSLLRGNGDGTFQPAVDASVAGQFPYGLDVVDLDGDGDLDLVIPVRGANAWQPVRNDGTGHFTAGELHPGGNHCHTVAAADWDHDGDIDVIAGFAISQNMFYYPQGSTPSVVSSVPARNASGVPPSGVVQLTWNVDLATPTLVPAAFPLRGAQSGTHAVTVSWSAPDHRLTLTTTKPFLAGETATLVIKAGMIRSSEGIPFPGDLRQFVIAGAPSPGSLVTGSPMALPGSDPVDVCAADFDGDGHADLAVANFLSGDITLLLTGGTGRPEPAGAIPAGTSPVSIVPVDLDGDGDVDLAVADLASSAVDLILNGPTGFGAPQALLIGESPFSIVAGDIDRDGDEDLVLAVLSPPGVRVLTNTGAGSFMLGPFLATSVAPTDVAIADADLDGALDVVAALGQIDAVQVFLSTAGGGFRTGGVYPTGDVPMAVLAGDADGDGQMDLACSDYGGGSVSVLKNGGGGQFNAPLNLIAASLPRGIWGGDLTGDGRLDLVTVNSGGATVSLFKGLGGGAFDTALSLPVGTTPYAAAGGDFDGDGRSDLAVVSRSSRDLAFFWGSNAVGAPITVEGPMAVGLVNAWPNPFSTSVAIQLAVPRADSASLDIYDVAGRAVARLLEGPVAPGTRILRWDGRDSGGRRVSSGVYFLRLDVDGRRYSKRILRVR